MAPELSAVYPDEGLQTDCAADFTGDCAALGVEDLLRQPLAKGSSKATLRKELGAYYTDVAVADFVLRWAVTTGRETVLDPSSGDGVFLAAAAERVTDLGGDSSRQIYGVEIDSTAHRRFLTKSTANPSIATLLHANFFEVGVEDLPAADAVVGNPPFIRYQRFSGLVRQTALQRAREAGVEISRLTSSWAPFLVHASLFVRPGGKLAVVAPSELTHAAYARPVLDYLRRAFRVTRVLSFSRRLFPSLSEDTVLLLAAGRGQPFESLRLIDLPGISALENCRNPETELAHGVEIDARLLEQGQERLHHYLLPERTRRLYRELLESTSVATLGELAYVGIGYVTGDNDFFHLNRQTVQAYGLPSHFLRPAACNGSELVGLRFSRQDWETFHNAGRANLLLHISNGEQLPDSLQAYLLQGSRRGTPSRYKCRVRKPWYSVPHVHESDGFLTYMSGTDPKFVANQAGAVAPNTLHLVQLHPHCSFSATGLAAAWQTTLTALSCELEGHSLGGGMLKLEPTEARRVAIATAGFEPGALEELSRELDGFLRSGRVELAREHADEVLLHRGLGLSRADTRHLREGWLLLRARRLHR